MVQNWSHPQRITHPCDKNHVLSLTSTAGSSYSCNACGGTVYDWCYSCRACNIDLHNHCAAIPLTRTHHSHPHGLGLAFSSPYKGSFNCDVCNTEVSGQWFYRCGPCKFDVHLACMERTRERQLPNQPPPRHRVRGKLSSITKFLVRSVSGGVIHALMAGLASG